MKHKHTALDKVMEEPVMCGGMIWSYGRISTLLQADGISDIYLAAATKRPISSSAFDTRKLSWEMAKNLWEAMGIGDCETIQQIMTGIL